MGVKPFSHCEVGGESNWSISSRWAKWEIFNSQVWATEQMLALLISDGCLSDAGM